MKTKSHQQSLIAILLIAAVVCVEANDGLLTGSSPTKPSNFNGSGTSHRFPDFRDDPAKADPPWTGHLFHLSQDYPTKAPPPEKYPWKKFDPRTHWKEYLMAVLDYCYEGNIECDWDVEKNAKRKWYHAPWLHWGRNGREFVHGLTHERVSQPGELAPTQVSMFQNWAVGAYNAPGGYVIKQVWCDPDNPVDAAFQDGTVSVKLLFTQANDKQVPYLSGAKEWQAYIYSTIAIPTNAVLSRKIDTLRLLQIDVAVRDTQVDDTTGWVFGTFVYNGDLPGKDPWHKMVPVGLAWGNDDDLTIAKQRGGQVLKQSIINTGPELPFQHLGYAGRLDGPVDNPISSCLSCHSTAQWPPEQLVPPVKTADNKPIVFDSPEWMRWFRTIRTGVPFSNNAIPLGYSLQLSSGLQNYHDWLQQQSSQGGFKSEESGGRLEVVTTPSANAKVRTCPVSREGLRQQVDPGL